MSASLSPACLPPPTSPRRARIGFTRSSTTASGSWRGATAGVRLLTRNGHGWAARYPLIVEAFDDTLAGSGEQRGTGGHATLDSVPARRLRRCRGRSRAFVSGRGVCACLDVAEAGGALRANGSLENIFEFLLVKPRENPSRLAQVQESRGSCGEAGGGGGVAVKRPMMIEAIAKRKAAAKVKAINFSIRLPEATWVLEPKQRFPAEAMR
jgi:hypothetical protein